MTRKSKKPSNSIKLFEGRKIRATWDIDREEWFFSIEDVVAVLTDSKDPKQYVKKMKQRDEELRKGWVHFVTTLTMETNGGPQKISCSNTEGILRIIQSIPSKKAEPFKLWLARVGKERIDEINDPELAAQRMRNLYRQKGYDEVWIEHRERGITNRNNLTHEWDKRGANRSRDYAILTNEIYKTGFGLTAQKYRDVKEIDKTKNLRDSMTSLELALTSLGEATATELHRENDSYGMGELKNDVGDAGKVINTAKKEIEKHLKKPVVSKQNHLDLTGQRKLRK